MTEGDAGAVLADFIGGMAVEFEDNRWGGEGGDSGVTGGRGLVGTNLHPTAKIASYARP